MRRINLITNKHYHVFNRGANKQQIFKNNQDYLRFLNNIWEFNNDSTYEQRQYYKNQAKDKKQPRSEASERGCFATSNYFFQLPKMVDVICYSLLPNHYHFILKQLTDDGIKIFMHKIGTGYTNYFNAKYDRSGVLFQGPFKAYPTNDESKLCWLSAYINCNYQIHKLGVAESWQFCSYLDYLNLRDGKLASKKDILELFKNNIQEYKKYCDFVIQEMQNKKVAEKMMVFEK